MMGITIEARRNFVEGMVPLSLWMARKLWREGMPLWEAITARTNIYRLTSLWDGKNHPATPPEGWKDIRWEEVIQHLEDLFMKYADAEDTSALEREGLEFLWPLLEPRLEIDVRNWPRLEDLPFGFFQYHYLPEERSIDLHLDNPFAPKSPFKDPQARAQELGKLLDDASSRTPTPLKVNCITWLNSFPPFQAFFPPEWVSNASEPTPLRHYFGWWGQMTDSAGRFHARNGAYLRQTGKFPYACVACSCSVTALRKHLQNKFGIKGN